MPQKNSDEIIRDDRQCVWHPFTWMPGYLAEEPLVIAGAEGAHLITTEGERLIDGNASMWLNVHGHARAELAEAIAAQARKYAHVSVFGQTHPLAATLARRLADIAPAGLTHVFYSDDGATAVEVGLKLAFQRAQIRGETARTRFIALQHAYHGDTLGAVSVGDIEHFHHTFRPLLYPVHRIPTPVSYAFDSVVASSLTCAACLDMLEYALDEHAGNVCGLIIEPIVQGAAGMRIHPEGYLRGVRQLCTQYNVPMIADEVFVGFGRTGTMFACEREGVSPDILCLAKGLTGGTVPLAVTMANDAIYETFQGADRERCTFFHGHSYCANPIGCAAALASLDLFKTDDTLAHVADLAAIIAEDAPRFRALAHVGDCRHVGAVFAVDLVATRNPLTSYDASQRMGAAVCRAARKHGLLIRPLDDVVYLVPPLAITADDLRKSLDAIHNAIVEVTG